MPFKRIQRYQFITCIELLKAKLAVKFELLWCMGVEVQLYQSAEGGGVQHCSAESAEVQIVPWVVCVGTMNYVKEHMLF